MAGQWWRRRKSRRDAGGIRLSMGLVLGEILKKEVIDFCRNAVIPFTFQEKMRMASGSGGPGGLDGGGCVVAVVVT